MFTETSITESFNILNFDFKILQLRSPKMVRYPTSYLKFSKGEGFFLNCITFHTTTMGFFLLIMKKLVVITIWFYQNRHLFYYF